METNSKKVVSLPALSFDQRKTHMIHQRLGIISSNSCAQCIQLKEISMLNSNGVTVRFMSKDELRHKKQCDRLCKDHDEGRLSDEQFQEAEALNWGS